MISDKVLKALEYDKIMQRVASLAQCVAAKQRLLQYRPCVTLADCSELQAQTLEADTLLYVHGIFPSLAVDDVTESLVLAHKGVTLSMAELLKVARLLRTSGDVRQTLTRVNENVPIIKGYAQQLYADDRLAKDIDMAIISESEMSDNASGKLASIRMAIRRGNEKLKEKLQAYVSGREYAAYLQDALVTKRGDRYVIPVKSECRSSVKGIVHDQSASGQTVYIEPLAVVEMNNELRQLALDEQKEIERILSEFSHAVGNISGALQQNLGVILELDVIFARAMYGHSINGTTPLLNDQGRIRILEGRHPLIEKHKVVPVTVRLGDDFDVLLVTGPNTGGKTVTLKLTGLLVLMACSGLFVPAKQGTELSLFDQIFTDIGDEQSIEQNLSTFSSHMTNVVHMVDNLNDKSLLLIDELGSGTDPEQGASLAVHITDYIVKHRAKAVITTHYSQLKEYSYATPRVENASMDFDPQTFEPLYKLIIGIPGTSNAIEIARRLGLKQEIVEAALGGLDKDKISFEEVLTGADQTRRKAEAEREKYQLMQQELQEQIRLEKQEQNKLRQQIDKLNTNARKEVKRLVDIALAEVNDIVDELKKMLDSPTQANYFEATKLRKRLQKITVDDEPVDDTPETVDEPPQVGDRVYVNKFHDVATLTSINKNGEYIVTLGKLKSIVRRADVRKLKVQQTAAPEKPKPMRTNAVLHNEQAKRELYLLGMTCDEAIYRLDKFLDDASCNKVAEVKIIHGMGTGALRNAVWDYLQTASVVSYRSGQQGEGGRGVTIVRLL